MEQQNNFLPTDVIIEHCTAYKDSHTLEPMYYCYNLCTLPASIYLPGMVKEALGIQFYEQYSIAVKHRDWIHFSAYLPTDHRGADKPFIYLVDSISCVSTADPWFKWRDCCHDIIIDAQGEILHITEELLTVSDGTHPKGVIDAIEMMEGRQSDAPAMYYGVDIRTDELVTRDLKKYGHQLIVGMSGSGRTYLIKQYIYQLIPSLNEIHIFHEHRQGEYDEFANIPNVHIHTYASFAADANKIIDKINEIGHTADTTFVFFDDAGYAITMYPDSSTDLFDFIKVAKKYNIRVSIVFKDFASVPDQIKNNTSLLCILRSSLPELETMDLLTEEEKCWLRNDPSNKIFYPGIIRDKYGNQLFNSISESVLRKESIEKSKEKWNEQGALATRGKFNKKWADNVIITSKKSLLRVVFVISLLAIGLIWLTDINCFCILAAYWLILSAILLISKPVWYRKG